ncbi:MAG: hypothetical protein Q8P67_27360, partial [archaeon]|nr:hypothetical protein [archaeon]
NFQLGSLAVEDVVTLDLLDIGIISIGNGGTSATEIEAARNNFQLGSLAVEDTVTDFEISYLSSPTIIFSQPNAIPYVGNTKVIQEITDHLQFIPFDLDNPSPGGRFSVNGDPVDEQTVVTLHIPAHLAADTGAIGMWMPDGITGQIGIRIDCNATSNSTQFPENGGFGYRYIEFRSNFEGGTSQDVTAMVASLGANDTAQIVFVGGGSDYAEFLPKRSAEETLVSGDVVGVFADGTISLSTEGALHLLVVSTAPSVIGNMPPNLPEDVLQKMSIVGMLGQVPTKVRGTVEEGSILVSSGLSDGYATAISLEQLSASPSMFSQVVGIAWEPHTGSSDGRVNTAVGLSLQHLTARLFEHQARKLVDLERRLALLEARL